MRGLDGKTAIVTGGATLIGAAVVRAFCAAGRDVAVADIDEEGGRRLADELGDAVLFSPTDIRDDAQLERLAAGAAERFGGIDFLVNLACSYVDKGLASTREDWLESLNVNVASAALAAKIVRPYLVERGGGRDRQLRVDLREGRADRTLALPGGQGGDRAADAQHGDGPRSRRHPRQLRLARLDLVEGDGRAVGRTTGRRRTASPRRSTCSAAPAIPRRWRTSCSSSVRTTRRS